MRNHSRPLCLLARLSCLAILTGSAAFGQVPAIPSSVSLAASPNPASYGRPVTLTATVTTGATGKVTFYDGVNILGVAQLSGNQATLTTVMLPSGKRSLRAYYQGNSSYAASSSAAVPETVVAGVSAGFQPSVNYDAGRSYFGVVTGDFNGDGKLDFASCAGGVLSFLGNGDGTFRPSGSYAPNCADALVAGDFDGDGEWDLVVGSGSSLAFLKGNGDGTFQPEVVSPLPSGMIVALLAVADFNGDGIADLAATDPYAHTLGIILGNGDGTFLPGSISMMSSGPSSLAVADFNSDGKADVAVAGATGPSVFLGNGDGTLQNPIVYPSQLSIRALAANDLNGDGKTDLVAALTSQYLVVLLGDGAGGFTAQPRNPIVSSEDPSLVVEDFNGDGKPDIAIAEWGYMSVSLGNGDGTLGFRQVYAGYGFDTVATGDFNGDGRPDLLGTGSETRGSGFSVFLANPTPDLTPAVTNSGFTQGQTGAQFFVSVTNVGSYASSGAVQLSGTLPSMLTPTAIGGSGWSCTLATLTCTRSDSLATGASYPQVTITVNVAASPIGGAAAVFTVSGGGDQNSANNRVSTTVAVRLGSATTLTSSPNPATLGQAVTLTATVTAGATGEVDFLCGSAFIGGAALSGGQAVLITTALPPGALSLRAQYLGDSNYGPSASNLQNEAVNPASENGAQPFSTYTVDNAPQVILTADLNGDGKADLLTLNQGQPGGEGTISVLLGNGDGTLGSAVNYHTGLFQPNIAIAGDFNNDGKLDLLAGWSGGGFSLLVGNGDGTFQAAAVVDTSSYAPIGAADFNGDGRLDLVARGAALSNYVVLFGNGDGTFQQPIAIALQSAYLTLRVADMNRDGKPDLLVEDSGRGGGFSRFSVLPGNGDGTFQTAIAGPALGGTTLSTFPYAFAIGDFNGDGKLDIAVTCFETSASSQTDYLILGNGDGTLQPPIAQPFGGESAFAMAGDFNGDGKLDFAYTDYIPQIFLAFGNGAGSLQTPVAVATNGNPTGIAEGDFNGDGKPDFAVSTGSNLVEIFLGGQLSGVNISSSHFGSFTAGKTGSYQITVSGPEFAATGGLVTATDTLPSGLTATAIAGPGWNCTLNTLTCTRSDALAPASSYPAITVKVNAAAELVPSVIANQASVTYAGGVTTATDDTRIVAFTTTTLTIPPGTATLGQPLTFTANVNVGAAGSVLFAADGAPIGTAALVNSEATFVTSSLPAGRHTLSATYAGDSTYGASVSSVQAIQIVTSPTSGFGPASAYPARLAYSPLMATADLNGDGVPDLAAPDGNQSIAIMLGAGGGAFAAPVSYSVGGPAVSFVIADFNNDGRPDIAATTSSTNVSILFGRGDGTFQSAVSSPTSVGNGSLAAGDINGDGKTDLLVATNGSTALLFGNGDGTFQPPASLTASTVAVADLNSDGIPDVIIWGSPGLGSAIGNGDGTFQAPVYYSNCANSCPVGPITVGDLNGDGKLDMVQQDSSGVDVFLGNGDGTFQAYTHYAGLNGPGSIALADVNGDGNLDVVATGTSYATVSILLGNGDGTLRPQTTVPSGGSGPNAVVAADFNGDGRTDLAIANGGENTVTVLLGVFPSSLSVASSHLGRFALGQAGAVYTLTVANAGPNPTSAPVTVTDTLPAGLAATAISGSGWSCTLATLSCTRADALAAGASYPAITLTVNVTANSPGSVTNQVSVIGGNSPAANATDFTSIDATYSYLVGDVSPSASAVAPYFGDNTLDIADLIQELFAVNSVPGFTPASCTDRFDAMDIYPPDTSTARGGDGALNISDLILELFRVNNLDTSRPVRTSLRATCSSGPSGISTGPLAARRAEAAAARPHTPPRGSLSIGRPEAYGAGEERAAIYLQASAALQRIAVTFALGDGKSPLRFQPAPDAGPSLAQDTQPGVVAAAWLNGLSLPAGQRLLLGYITGPAGSLGNLTVYGLSAAGVDDGRETPLETQRN